MIKEDQIDGAARECVDQCRDSNDAVRCVVDYVHSLVAARGWSQATAAEAGVRALNVLDANQPAAMLAESAYDSLA